MANDRLSNYATTIAASPDGQTRVTYHSTVIVAWNAEAVTLDSGGWQTVTTKRKMNQAAKQFGLGFSVFQRDHEWFVTTPSGETLPFYDGIELRRTECAA
jgi:hypothetical protein